ncbi:TetR/AcrR family transcriptional regulator [Actinophytocola sp.]|uniref:TetR/AcrR family transcriptional regulator n=1 Tax=Actinophytocola sp. TaxID=1872138 RepID=UPI003D6ADC51
MTKTAYEFNQGRVIAAAADLFAKNGYHGTGVAELGEVVGLGRGALYHYIGSKESLLFAICSGQVDRMNNRAAEILTLALTPEKLLHEMARALLRNIADHRAEWTVFFREFSALTGERRERVLAARKAYEGHWRRAMDRGVEAGKLKETPPLLLKGILGMLNYTYLWFEPDGPLSPDELADQFIDALLYGIRA